MKDDLLARITQGIVEGDPQGAVDLSKQALEAGIDPLTIIEDGLTPGMTIVGDKFAAGEFFLPNMIIAARGMQLAMDMLEPSLRENQQQVSSAGTVVIGTVKGDIHEIGKSLVAAMLSARGFQVLDLGVDVPTDLFLEKVREAGADILGLSALLTTTMTVQREVIQALEQEGLREVVKVIVGGAPVTESWAQEIGADGYAEDAVGAVQLALQLAG